MRTTIELDDDLAGALTALAQQSGSTFEAAIESCLRAGIPAEIDKSSTPYRGRSFVVRAKPLGLRAGLSYDNLEALLDEAEGPMHR